MMILVWLGLAFFGGLALFLVVPWTAAQIAGEDWIDRVGDAYVWLAQTAAHKSAIVERNGNLDLVSKRFDSDIKADKDEEHGDPRHHRDGFDVVSRLRNKSFGVALSDRAEYVSPLLSELGERFWRAREQGEIGPETRKGERVMRDGVIIPDRAQAVDIGQARHLTTGAAEPEDGHDSYLKTKISQEKFNERVSFGQGFMIILAFIGSAFGMYWMAGQGGGESEAVASGANETVVSFLWLLASTAGLDVTSLSRKTIAISWVIGWLVLVPLTALVFGGLFTAVIATIVMVSVALAIPGGIALLGPSIPKAVGLILSRMMWILAQLTVGRGALVRRETGAYEHSRLLHADEDADHDYETELSDGKLLEIDGSEGDLYRFGWAPLLITEEKGKANMDALTSNPPAPRTDGGTDTNGGRQLVKPKNERQGYRSLLPIPDEDEWLVTLPQLWSWCQGTAEAQTIEQGRDNAFRDHGGEQQMGTMIFTIAVLVAAVFGGAMGLLAGGGVPL